MNRKGEELGGTAKKCSDRFASLIAAQTLALPYRILGEQGGEPIRVVVVVTIRGVPRLEIANGIDIFQGLYTLFKLSQSGRLAGHVNSPRFWR